MNIEGRSGGSPSPDELSGHNGHMAAYVISEVEVCTALGRPLLFVEGVD